MSGPPLIGERMSRPSYSGRSSSVSSKPTMPHIIARRFSSRFQYSRKNVAHSAMRNAKSGTGLVGDASYGTSSASCAMLAKTTMA